MGAIELIKSDLFRYAGTTSSKGFVKTYVKEAGFRFSVAFRLVNEGGAELNCPYELVFDNGLRPDELVNWTEKEKVNEELQCK